MSYLTADELSHLTGYKANQFARMRRWLTDHGWPFESPRGGCPQVWRTYHDQRMSGTAPAPASVTSSNDAAFTPNRARLEALQNARKKKRA